MDLNVLKEKYQEIVKKIKAYNFVCYLISWDSQTEAPDGCFEERAKQMKVLSESNYKLLTSNETIEVVNELYERRNELDEVLKHEITVFKESNDKTKKVPMEEYSELTSLLTTTENIWAKAKEKNDFSMFSPYLKKIINLIKKMIKHIETDKLKGYDILLDEYERGMTRKEYDEFFNLLKSDLVPFVKKVTSKKLDFDDSFFKLIYPKDLQKKFTNYIEDVMCFDKHFGLSKESAHPFTSGFGTTDIRYTNHFYEDNFISSIFSAIHELGHATYEAQVDKNLDDTLSGGGASMAMHESQSRFYENIIGRSEEFWEVLFPTLKDTFPTQLKNVTLDDFIKLINRSENSLIRTEADELTYPIHIMIRYEIEKALFDNEIDVDDLPQVWNKAIKDNLGIDCPSDAMGVLQDVHWAGGSFGYFPTYALGSAYASQIYYSLLKDVNISEALKNGNTKPINDWLKNKIHKFGSSKYPKEILRYATGEDFNPNYYIKYLKEKYSKIYNIEE